MSLPVQDAFEAAAERLPELLRAAAVTRWESIVPVVKDLPVEMNGRNWVQTAARVLSSSDFVARTVSAHGNLLRELLESGDLFRPANPTDVRRQLAQRLGAAATDGELKSALRQIRNREMVRIAWRDLSGWADLDEILSSLSSLADACIGESLLRLQQMTIERDGEPIASDSGHTAHLVVVGMGKLGGEELNFSSDVDLVLAYSRDGQTSRSQLSNHEYFTRLGQRLINVLGDSTADGFAYRVDMRLRPNGASGPLVLSFDAMEQYYQLHGRTWERYAWIKARVVAGNRPSGDELLTRLRPFVYRRYLDYSAIEEIRTLKAAIQSELRRKGIEDNIKLGPGGIREVEFIGQAFQLIRGGRDSRLQDRRVRTVIQLLAADGDLTPQAGKQLIEAYEFLRRTENHLQEIDDRQLQELPAAELDRVRLAASMGFGSWPDFQKALDGQRRRVHQLFESVFVAPQGETPSDDPQGLHGLWSGHLDDESSLNILAGAGFGDPEPALKLLRGLRGGSVWNSLTASGRERMDRLMPLLVGAISLTAVPNTTLARLVTLVEAIGRRSVYLSLLVENPMALSQLVKLCAASEWIARYLTQHPILLDELMDPASLYSPRSRAALSDELRARLVRLPAEDLENQMDVLREFRHAQVLRVAAADLGGGLSPTDIGRHLGEIAEVVVAASLDVAFDDLVRRHGRPCKPGEPGEAGAGFAVVAYGKLGSLELGYTSDLDMIFLHDSEAQGGATAGPRAIPNEVFFARLAQRLIHILTARTSGGILYEVDTRLRPSGGSGMLVTHPVAFRDYQRTNAWVWEHQALIRARPIAGDAGLCWEFERIRNETLCRQRDPDKLRAEVKAMRDRMRGAQPPHDPGQFNLKHDAGGMIDVEFMVQYAVLRWAHEHPELVRHRGNIPLIDELESRGLVNSATASLLRSAYREYLAAEQRLKLMERRPLVMRTELGETPERVVQLWKQFIG